MEGFGRTTAMATTNPPQSIADWYNSCITTFEKSAADIDNLAPGLDPDANKTKVQALQLVRDQIGRFRVWGKNLGAHRRAGSKASLDYKLKEASHVRNTVLELLEELEESLRDLEVLCSTVRLQKSSLDPATTATIEENEDDIDDIDDISDSGSATSGSGISFMSDLVFMVEEIGNIITCLYNLSLTMRQPVPQDRLQKCAEIDLSHYEYFDKRHVQEKFPDTKSKPYLIERLGNANTQRRQYFEYQLRQHEKSAQERKEVVVPTAPVPQSTHTSINPDADDTVPPRRTVAWIQDTDATATVITAAQTVETDGGRTATSFGTTRGTVKLLKVPDPPNAAHVFAGNAFQCPYCYSSIIVKKSKAWQRHVFRDLQPYVCTFEFCTKPNRLFETRHDWYDHELRHHRREWYCAKCRISFPTSSNFISHLKESHPGLAVEEQDISVLVDGCERALTSPQQCPLCTAQSEHTIQKLRKHLGRHMQQLALFALPKLETDKDVGEDPSSKAVLGGEDESSDDEDEKEMSELEFNSNPSEGRPEERPEERPDERPEESPEERPEEHPEERPEKCPEERPEKRPVENEGKE